MEIGRCPACAQPYTAGDVAGYGVLRPRPAADGGPTVLYRCRRCDVRITLIPHGGGRFAPPGEAPPPGPVPPEHRAPPWATGEARAEPPRAPPPPPPSGPPGPSPRTEPPPPPTPPPPEEERPLTLSEALEILGVPPTAERAALERAFRERSLLCHPDKVAHLDPDFQALADRKFRRLRAAYDLLTR